MAESTKQKMLEAKRLIQQKQYDDARVILEGVNHPKAQEWLSKLPAPAKTKSPKQSSTNSNIPFPLWQAIAGVEFVIILLLVAGLVISLSRQPELSPQELETIFQATVASSIAEAFGGNSERNADLDITRTAIQIMNNDTAATANAVRANATAIAERRLTPYPAGSILPPDDRGLSFKVSQIGRPAIVEVRGLFDIDVREPTIGLEYITLTMVVYCADTEVSCYTSSVDPELILEDGRIVRDTDDLSIIDNTLPDEQIAGGLQLTVQRVYEVPIDAPIIQIKSDAGVVNVE